MNPNHLLRAGLLATALLAGAAQAEVSGTMNVQLTLETGCIVSDDTNELDNANFGTIDFGTAPTLFAVDLEAQSLIGGSNVQLNCSDGADLNIEVGDGLNVDTGVRRMISGANYVQYRLFTQAGGGGQEYVTGGTALDLGSVVPSGGGEFNLPIYGVVEPQAGLAAGTYNDTVTVTLTF